jgi:hypothetical protein
MSPSWTARVGPAAHEEEAEGESGCKTGARGRRGGAAERDLGRSAWRSPMATSRDGEGRKVVGVFGRGGSEEEDGKVGHDKVHERVGEGGYGSREVAAGGDGGGRGRTSPSFSICAPAGIPPRATWWMHGPVPVPRIPRPWTSSLRN